MSDPDLRAARGADGEDEPAQAPGENGGAPRRSWVTLAPLIVFGVLALIFLVQLLRGGDPSELRSALIGRPAPVTELAPLEGLTENGFQLPGITNAAFRGQVTVVNVWGSWCAPCRVEHPYVLALGHDERIQVVGINQRDDPDNALGFLLEVGNPYDAVGVDRNGRASIDWGVYGVPESFLVDRSGVVRFKLIGPMNERRYRDEMMPQIEALLAEQPAPPPA